MTRQVVTCEPAEADGLRELAAVYTQAERDLTVAFTMFSRAHALPSGTTFAAVNPDGTVVVTVPDAPQAPLEHG